jgi:hypothetical protein
MAKRDAWTESPEAPEVLSTPPPPVAALPSVLFGTLLAMEGAATPLICSDSHEGEVLRARTVVSLEGTDIGSRVALAFEGGDPGRPVVMGVLREDGANALGLAPAVEVSVDGQRLLVSARDRLVLRCGEASITLTRAGKVLICGTYVLSQSSGANRLKGGSIQLN